MSPDTWVGARDRSWGIRPVGEQPAPGRPDQTAGWPQFLVALHADTLRRLLPVRDRPGRRRRQPRHQRSGAHVARRSDRATRMARGGDHVPVGHASPRAGGDAPARREPQAVRRGVRDPRLRRARSRFGVRRRRLEPRPLDGRGLGRPGELRPHRSRRSSGASRSACSTTSPRPRATAPRATACSSTPTWAVTLRAASPTSDPSRPEPVLSGEKILITGPAGQIAFPLAEYLAADNEVWGIARFGDPATRAQVDAIGVTTLVCDVGDGDFSELPDDFTYVLHLAAFMGPGLDFDHAIRVNAEGTGLLLAHCRKAKAALVMSTHSVYRPQDDPMHVFLETDPIGEVNAAHSPTYSMSKIAQEAVARYCARSLDLPVVIARMNASYGPNGGLPTMHLDAIMAGNAITDALGPVPVQPHPPRRHQRADRGLARRRERPGDGRQLGRRRGRQRAGVGELHGRAHRQGRGGERRGDAGHVAGIDRERRQARLVHRTVHRRLEGRHRGACGRNTARRRRHDGGTRHRCVVRDRRGDRAGVRAHRRDGRHLRTARRSSG